MPRHSLIIVPLALLIAGMPPVLKAEPAVAPPWKEQIAEAAQAELLRSGTPSLQVAVGYDGAVIFERAFGLADVENSVIATAETKYRTASVSKWLTATAAMRLVEQGKLDLDKPVQTYCPQFPKKRRPVSTRQLLTHTSGIRHYADYDDELAAAKTDAERIQVEIRRYRDELGEYTRYTDLTAPLENFKNDALTFAPGTDWLYSSFGYRVLGCVLEGASGRSYRTLMDEEVFGPAGMNHTLADDAWAIVPHRASGYRLDREKPLRRADLRDVSENLPAGGHLTTATDITLFAQAFNSGRLVSADSVALMVRQTSAGAGPVEDYSSWRHAIPSAERYGYGVMFFPHENEQWIGHTGRQAGASAIIVLVPGSKISIAVLTNVKGWGGYMRFARTLRSIVENGIQ